MLIDRLRQAPGTRRRRGRGTGGLEYGGLAVVAVLAVGMLGPLDPAAAAAHPRSGACGRFGSGCGTEAVLSETRLGRTALQWVEDNGVQVIYRAGGASYYDGDAHAFYIDTNQSPEERANTFVHEVNHAEHHDADIGDLGREEFVERSIDEEVEGTVEAIQNNRQLQRNRGGNGPDTLLQREYEDAYDDAVVKARRARSELGLPALDDETARRAGERAGRERVEQAFANGEVVSSLDGGTYAENYGEAWDDAHNCLLRIFC